jgi:4-amino-4-deoxy-L-arabinose transferase-like glycosyltransferase
MSHHFTAISVLLRWFVALFGVFATYNPSGYSYFHWVQQGHGQVALRVFAGVALVIFYVVHLRATLRSLGPIGIGLATALFGSIAWLLTQWHVVDLARPDDQSVVSLAITASVLGVGMSWSAIRYRISGQYDSEDVGVSPI